MHTSMNESLLRSMMGVLDVCMPGIKQSEIYVANECFSVQILENGTISMKYFLPACSHIYDLANQTETYGCTSLFNRINFTYALYQAYDAHELLQTGEFEKKI